MNGSSNVPATPSLKALEFAPWNGWTGSMIGNCSNPPAEFHPLGRKHAITPKSSTLPWRRHSKQTASRKLGAVQVTPPSANPFIPTSLRQRPVHR
jgi:hypothetical protein